MMLHPLLAQADAAPARAAADVAGVHPSPIAEAAVLMVVGMAVVFGALLLLLVVVAAVQRAAREVPARPARAQIRRDRAPAAAPATATPGLDPRTLAILAAAATAALGRPAVVTRARVTHLSAPGRGMEPWSQAGRRSIMTSHQPHH